MVSTQGFNALLKLVEEPPEHLRFIFATTEPEKVIATIRSRTHHYPFRLIPPRVLSDYLAELCDQEGVKIDPAALPLVVRAGAGSARDSLSVLDQLLGGAGPDGRDVRRRDRPARLHPRQPARRGRRRLRRRRRRRRVRRRRQGDRDRPGPSPVHRGRAAPAARPRDHRGRARRPGHGTDRRPRGPGRATGRPGRPVRQGRARAGGRHRRRRADRDAGGHDAAAAAGAGVRARAPSRRPTTTPSGLAARLDRLERRVSVVRCGAGAAPQPAAAAARPPRRRSRSEGPAATDAPPRPSRPPNPRRSSSERSERPAEASPPAPPAPRSRPSPQPPPAPAADRRRSAWPTYAGSGPTCSSRSRRCGGSPGSC